MLYDFLSLQFGPVPIPTDKVHKGKLKRLYSTGSCHNWDLSGHSPNFKLSH